MSQPEELFDETVEHNFDNRQLALVAACMYHGLASANPQAIPPATESILGSANLMLRWLNGQVPDEELRTRRRP